ncbi:aminoglycoside adenylyltransferase domain-containing protein [Streptomyces pilosus]|uniref:aminoglycoside adenylyltransferase domain-containing protein n=1 Tax=Streptomyces pilosus TaxID=28893 RepID=UPI0036F6848E
MLDDLGGDTRNVLLTFARVRATLSTGRIKSRTAATDWALARLPPEHRPVLEHARQLCLRCSYSEERRRDRCRSWGGRAARPGAGRRTR